MTTVDQAIRDAVRSELAALRADPPPPKLALTVAEAQTATGAGRDTIRRWITEGRLAKVPHTTRTLIPTAALERFVNSQDDVAEPTPIRRPSPEAA